MELQAGTSTSQKGIPQDIAMDILAKLTIKDLIRFKSVSKHWRLIISDPLFAQSYSDKKSPMYLNWSDHKKTYKMGPRDKLLGYDDGLLCVRHKTEDVLLMNPATGECRNLKLPDEYSRMADGTWRYYKYMGGIGYAKATCDYKVVAIFFDEDTSVENNRVMVFPLRENRWRIATGTVDFPYSRGRKNGVHRAPVNGAIHWVVKDGKGARVIVAFDLETEEIKELPLPCNQRVYADMNCKVHLGCLKGRLAVVLHKRPQFLYVWLMKEYGVTWIKVSLDLSCRISGWKGPVFDLADGSGDADKHLPGATGRGYIRGVPMVLEKFAFVETPVSPHLVSMKLV